MRKLILITIFGAILFYSCNNETLFGDFDLGKIEEFHQGEINQARDNSLEFTITEIHDSRCPSDVVCVWQGKVDLKLEIESPQSGTLFLNTYDNLIDTFANYSFTLIEVLPYPISTKAIKQDDYIIKMEINYITQNY